MQKSPKSNNFFLLLNLTFLQFIISLTRSLYCTHTHIHTLFHTHFFLPNTISLLPTDTYTLALFLFFLHPTQSLTYVFFLLIFSLIFHSNFKKVRNFLFFRFPWSSFVTFYFFFKCWDQ